MQTAISGAARIRILLAALAAALATVLGMSAAPAHAHDHLVSSSPANGETLTQPISEWKLTFSDNIQQMGTELRIEEANGGTVQLGAPEVHGREVVAKLPNGITKGEFRGTWRVVSSDGHPISGQIMFNAVATATNQANGQGGAAPRTSPAATAAATDSATEAGHSHSHEPAATSSAAPAAQPASTPAEKADSTAKATDGAPSWLPWVIGAVGLLAIAGALVAFLAKQRRRDDVYPADRAANRSTNSTIEGGDR